MGGRTSKHGSNRDCAVSRDPNDVYSDPSELLGLANSGVPAKLPGIESLFRMDSATS